MAVADLDRLVLEAAPLRVAGEHPVEVAGEQPGLLPARARPDLDDHVLVVVRVGLDHREPDLLFELAEALLGRAEQLAQLGVLAVLGEQLAGARGVVASRAATPARAAFAGSSGRYARPTSA